MAEPTPEAREAARKALAAWSLDCAGGEWLMADEAIDLVDRVARAIDAATRRERASAHDRLMAMRAAVEIYLRRRDDHDLPHPRILADALAADGRAAVGDQPHRQRRKERRLHVERVAHGLAMIAAIARAEAAERELAAVLQTDVGEAYTDRAYAIAARIMAERECDELRTSLAAAHRETLTAETARRAAAPFGTPTDETDRRVECLLHVRTDAVLLASIAYGLLAIVERDAARRERERCAKLTYEAGDEARGEQHAAAAYLRRYAAAESRRAQALRADAGTQAEPEARGSDRVVRALEGAAEIIEQGRHWR